MDRPRHPLHQRIMLVFLAALLFFIQDESEYPRLIREVRDTVQFFKEPDGALMPPAAHWDEALQKVDKVLNFQPTREFEAAYQLISAMLHLSKGNVAEAFRDFDHGLRVDPNSAPMFHFGLGLCYSAMGRQTESEQEFKLAANAAPAWSRPRMALAALHADAGRAKEAEEAVRESIALTDSPKGKARQYLLLAQMRQTQGDPKDAEDALRVAAESDPDDTLLGEYLELHLFNQSQVKPRGKFARLVENGLSVGSWQNTFEDSVTSSIGPTNPLLPTGSRFRAFRFVAEAGELLRFRSDSRAFQPFSALMSSDGKPVALHDIRSSYFSYIEYTAAMPGVYYLIISSYLPDQTGEFTVRRIR